MPAVTLELEEWYVLANWLRERENRLMYALRPKSDEWEFVHGLRRTIERQQGGATGTRDAAEASRTSEASKTAETPGTAEASRTKEATERARTAETAGTPGTVSLSDRQVAYLSSFLRRRARKLLLFPWRSRERRDVRHLRDHLRHEAEPSGDATARSAARGRRE